MNKEQIALLKKTGIIFAVFILIISFISGIYYLAFWLKKDAYYNAAEYVLKESPFCKDYKNLSISKDKLSNQLGGNFFNAVFKASYKNSEYYLVFVNLSGKYGTYQAVFLYSLKKQLKQSNLRLSNRSKHIIFCGIIGTDELEKPPVYYGISDFLLLKQMKKIEEIFTH